MGLIQHNPVLDHPNSLGRLTTSLLQLARRCRQQCGLQVSTGAFDAMSDPPQCLGVLLVERLLSSNDIGRPILMLSFCAPHNMPLSVAITYPHSTG